MMVEMNQSLIVVDLCLNLEGFGIIIYCEIDRTWQPWFPRAGPLRSIILSIYCRLDASVVTADQVVWDTFRTSPPPTDPIQPTHSLYT